MGSWKERFPRCAGRVSARGSWGSGSTTTVVVVRLTAHYFTVLLWATFVQPASQSALEPLAPTNWFTQTHIHARSLPKATPNSKTALQLSSLQLREPNSEHPNTLCFWQLFSLYPHKQQVSPHSRIYTNTRNKCYGDFSCGQAFHIILLPQLK